MSQFTELIKNFDRTRFYMRDFYIYGFKVRGEYTKKSARTYDNERRRIESWLGDYIQWDHSTKGKQIFLMLDAANLKTNPLYRGWKSKSFTDHDVMLHFLLLDLLHKNGPLTSAEAADRLLADYGYLADEQLIRRKANEYAKLALFTKEKIGRKVCYRLAESSRTALSENARLALQFFQGAAPLGVIGFFILDALGAQNRYFTYKHHFIVHTLDDEILLTLFTAISEGRWISYNQQQEYVLPLKILQSQQTGRRYAAIYIPRKDWFASVRLDHIEAINLGESFGGYNQIQQQFSQALPYCWGVVFGQKNCLEWVEMVIFADESKESYIIDRLQREGRGGSVSRASANVFRYYHEVFDANEMFPWLKTFIGRIIRLDSSNKYLLKKMAQDLNRLYGMYLPKEE